MGKFVNLHMHTETGSPLDGFARTSDIIERSKELGYDKIAVTDHGSMSGILDLYTEGKNSGLDVIPGMEVYCVNDRTVRVKGEHNAHLVLLAKNKEGYQNLLKLNFEGYKTGAVKVYDRVIPRVDLSLLEQHGKGIIASSACLAGTIPALLRQGKEAEAIELANRYKKIFDSFYLEVQPTELIGNDQTELNRLIVEMHKKTGIPIIVTLDSHYVYPDDRVYHHILLAIQSKKDIYDKTRLMFEANPLMSEVDLLDKKQFPEEWIKKGLVQEWIDNTHTIANQCEKAKYLDTVGGYKIPHFPIPSDPEFEQWKKKKERVGKTETELYFTYKVQKGWDKKIQPIIDREKAKDPAKGSEICKQYKERLNKEHEVITKMKFPDYFLIVADMLEECDRRGISRGTGRGSAGGCLLSFLLDITKLNPVIFDLMFSRFLNEDRISMPDIDSDICQSRRDEIKQYLIQKYGENKVAGIATFGTMKVKAAVKDVVRSLALGDTKSETFRLADRISKSVPDGDNPEVTFEEAYNYKDSTGATKNEFKEFCDTLSVDIEGKKITLKSCLEKFEGITRQMGIHAAGVIISTEPLTEILPMIVQNNIVATAYDGPTLEKAGYLKLDVLGLKTLDVIDDAVRYVKDVYGETITRYPMVSIDFDPKAPNAEQLFSDAYKNETDENKRKAAKAYRLYRRGKTSACFQVSGSGMQALLKNVKPNNIEDIAAVLALFRPGPLGSGMTTEYGERKNGRHATVYKHPDLEPILDKTYGILVYQEQVMRIATDIAGFTQAQADTLRKAVGKKIKKLMDEQEAKFKEGALAKGYIQEISASKDNKDVKMRLVDYLWDQIVEFAAYGFNKSHSVAYALTSYKQVYLKANYPAAFWAAVLSHEDDEQKRNGYISEIRQTVKSNNPTNHIKLTAVDINTSGLNYVCINPNEIRRDLLSLKGVGESAVEEIIAKRPFKDFLDFLDKVESRKINSRVLKALIQAGAFDSLNQDGRFTRKFLYYVQETVRTLMSKYKKKAKVDTIIGTDFKIDWDQVLANEITWIKENENPNFEYGSAEWDTERICEDEVEVYGMAVSSHPFDGFLKKEIDFQNRFVGRYITLDQDFDLLEENMTVATMGIVKFKPREIPCKNGTTLRNYTIEDRYGTAEVTVFESEYKNNKSAFEVGNIIQFIGTITKKYKKITFLSTRRGPGMIDFFSSKKKVT